MQNVAWPMTTVQKLKGMPARFSAERRLMPVMMPGSATGRISNREIASRPKNFERHTAAAASVPSSIATNVEAVATCSESDSAERMSLRSQATAHHFTVNPGNGKTKLLSSVLKAYRTMNASGTCRNATPRRAPALSGSPALPPRRGEPTASEGIEGSQASRGRQIDRHDHDGHDGECRGERDVARGALQLINRLADERARVADDARNDVVAERQRKSKDRAGHHARKCQRQDHLAESLLRRRAEVGGGFRERGRHALQRRDDRQDHERQPDVEKNQKAANVGD